MDKHLRTLAERFRPSLSVRYVAYLVAAIRFVSLNTFDDLRDECGDEFHRNTTTIFDGDERRTVHLLGAANVSDQSVSLVLRHLVHHAAHRNLGWVGNTIFTLSQHTALANEQQIKPILRCAGLVECRHRPRCQRRSHRPWRATTTARAGSSARNAESIRHNNTHAPRAFV